MQSPLSNLFRYNIHELSSLTSLRTKSLNKSFPLKTGVIRLSVGSKTISAWWPKRFKSCSHENCLSAVLTTLIKELHFN